MLIFAGNPGPQAADGVGGLQRQLARHVHVVEVDGGDGGYLVAAQAIGVVERGPAITLGEKAGRLG